MITCAEAVERLWDYLEGDLASGGREEVEEHLAFCRTCCGEVRFAEELRRVLGEHTRADLPDDVAERLIGMVQTMEERA